MDKLSCNFEELYGCKWTQDANNDLNWIRGTARHASRETGPSSDHTKGMGKHIICVNICDDDHLLCTFL